MNEDIKQLIEKESYIYWSKSDYKEKAEEAFASDDMCMVSAMARKVSHTSFFDGANFILSKWQEAERWRKAEDELPDKDGMYLVTTDKFLFIVAEYLGGFWVLDVEKYGVILRWKPIND